ncbi:amidase [uncultured Cyclobacterium sp.]|uniref:amidase n=1 Tax=uncultured Cyclobacterium sp. TaxID=453820 RepID=UPI0030EC9B53|tara:strand:+ start:87680 stop:89194 length:1515 start_codon:yes stop_codon:yes gene_type:complete
MKKHTLNNRRKFIAKLSIGSLGSVFTTFGQQLPKGVVLPLKQFASTDETEELLYMSATKVANMIKNQEISSEEVVKLCLDRIDEVNPKINAVVQIVRERALLEAKAADEAVKAGETLGLLHGVPMTIKDSFDTAGIISTAGTLGRKNYIPGTDATVVKRLKEEGAILLGKTNTPEFTMSSLTFNLIYGQTLNPYDLTRHPSGSSGGAAAILATGGSYFDVGTDSGGSVRAPAHACGITSIKPTSGRIPQTGHLPGYGDRYGSYQQPGPMARRVEDLFLLLSILCGPDQLDASISPVPLNDPADVDLSKLKIAYYTTNDVADPIPEIKKMVVDCANQLKTSVSNVTEARPPVLQALSEKRSELNSADGKAHLKRLIKASGTKVISPNLNITGEIVSADRYTKLVEEIDALKSKMLQFMDDFDIILCPVTSTAAMKVEAERIPGHWYTSEYNATGWPAAVVRAGTSDEGLPIGLQIVGKPWTEDKVLAVAAYLEEKFGGYSKPENI